MKIKIMLKRLFDFIVVFACSKFYSFQTDCVDIKKELSQQLSSNILNGAILSFVREIIAYK